MYRGLTICIAFAISEYEKQKNLPPGLISKTVISDPENGAWVRMERGELSLTEFAEAFSNECSKQVHIYPSIYHQV